MSPTGSSTGSSDDVVEVIPPRPYRTHCLRMRASTDNGETPRRRPAPQRRAAAAAPTRRSSRQEQQAVAQAPAPSYQICRPPDVVTATGDGPNGRTVVGFVAAGNQQGTRFVCTCHGTPFTSVGFLLQAGATDVSTPEV